MSQFILQSFLFVFSELEENVLGINEWSTVIPMFLFITAVLFIVYSTASKVGSLVHKNRKENLSFEH